MTATMKDMYRLVLMNSLAEPAQQYGQLWRWKFSARSLTMAAAFLNVTFTEPPRVCAR